MPEGLAPTLSKKAQAVVVLDQKHQMVRVPALVATAAQACYLV
jgi:hypothetical protein